jgi:EAL domain-containing protein (putative c-di-GMP-specific phosphodiesterase class I)
MPACGLVYVLDDDPAVGATIGLVAERCGLRSRVYREAPAFLDAMATMPPSHIVLDLVMPGTDGIEILGHLGRLGSRAQIVITSGVGRRVLEAAERLALEQGLDLRGTLSKPFSVAGLRTLLEADSRAVFPGLDGTSAAAEPAISAGLLREAMQGGELSVVYQPKIDCCTGEPIGVETLASWRRPDGTRVSPEMFVALAERSNLIATLTETVVTQALDWFAALGAPDLTLALNISTRSLEDRGIVDWLGAECGRRGIEPGCLVLEMTETAAMRDPMATLDVLTRFRLRGFRVSIDDFGVGYSSIAQLARLPFSELKVDRAFVRDLSEGSENRSIVKAIVGLGHSLGLVVAAEGVENPTALTYLQSIGCDHAQGFHIAAPLPPDEAAAWLMADRRARWG